MAFELIGKIATTFWKADKRLLMYLSGFHGAELVQNGNPSPDGTFSEKLRVR